MRDIDAIFHELPKLTVDIHQLSTGTKVSTHSVIATARKAFKQTISGAYASDFDISIVSKIYISISQIPGLTLKNGDKLISGTDEYTIFEAELVDYSATITGFYELSVERKTN